MAKQRVTVGAVVTLPLSSGLLGYGQILPRSLALFDLTSGEPLGASAIEGARVLFRTMFFHRSVTSGRWKKVGKAPIREELKEPLLHYKVGSFGRGGHGFFLMAPEGERRIERPETLVGLEPYVVFDADSIEERLLRHLSGDPLDVSAFRLEPRGDVDLWHPLYGNAGYDVDGSCKALLELARKKGLGREGAAKQSPSRRATVKKKAAKKKPTKKKPAKKKPAKKKPAKKKPTKKKAAKKKAAKKKAAKKKAAKKKVPPLP